MARNIVKLSFNTPPSLDVGIDRLASVLGYERADDGITVTAVEGDKTGVTLRDGQAVIYYRKKNLFYRELGVLVEHARHAAECEICEDGHFEVLSTMIDAGRRSCSIPALKKFIDYHAVMGYDMLMLYTEDLVELEERPYFGYMRGRYTPAELREIDDYAYEYGIELVGCLECYGHMGQYLIWDEAAPIKDTSTVMLAREEETFRFLDELIRTVSANLRSRRLHLGMDEAWDMGRGVFMDKHGYVDPFVIFNEFMDRLCAITDKYGLMPYIWNDMYFRTNDPLKQNRYCVPETVIPAEDIARIPKNLTLIYWHYGEEPFCDNYMLEKCAAMGRNVMYAGGLWNWIGHFPEHHYAMETTKFALAACRSHDVHEAMITMWANDGAECDIFANLFGMSYFAELCFDRDVSDEKLRSRFEACTDGNYDAFLEMSLYHNTFGEEDDYSANYHDRFYGKPLFWQDILTGLYDRNLFEKPMSAHYAACAEKMKGYGEDRWSYLYRFAYLVFDYLAVKCEIAEKLVPSYKSSDRDTLREIADVLLPLLREKTEQVRVSHRDIWFNTRKTFGWNTLDIRYGGVIKICDTAEYLIGRYLSGEDGKIEMLEEERLYHPLNGFEHYSAMFSPNLKV